MGISGFRRKLIAGLRGAWTTLEQRQARPERLQIAQNLRISESGVSSRDGISGTGIITAGKVTSIYSWINGDNGLNIQRIVFYDNGSAKSKDQVGGSITTLFTAAGRALMCEEDGTRLFMSLLDNFGFGAAQARIHIPLLGGSPVDVAFAGPLTITPTVSELGAGLCDGGAHKFGYIMESRTGFTGKPGPAPGDVFTPVSFTVGAGGKQLRLEVIFTTTPSDIAYLHPIMTTLDNPDKWFFVPDAAIAVPPGVPYTAWMTIDISDADLQATGEAVDDHFDFLSQNVGGAGPFNPGVMIAYGERMVYFYGNKVYVSNQRALQEITEAYHVIRAPGGRLMITGFQLRGTLYLFGPTWSFAINDNNDLPSTWGTPHTVSPTQGTTAPFGVTARMGAEHGWVANSSGLYVFDGGFEQVPISLFSHDWWKRINWATGSHAVTVVDDFTNQRVMVAVPLDGATEPTHILIWDYRRGKTPATVDFSWDLFHSNIGFAALAAVVDRATQTPTVMLGPKAAAAGQLMKYTPNISDDMGEAIHVIGETGLVMNSAEHDALDVRFGGISADVSGTGTIDFTIHDLGRRKSLAIPTVNLEAFPDDHMQEEFDFVSPNASIRFESNSVGTRFALSWIALFWRKWVNSK